MKSAFIKTIHYFLIVSLITGTAMPSKWTAANAGDDDAKFFKKADKEISKLIDDLQKTHNNLRGDLIKDLKTKGIDLGDEYLELENKDFNSFKEAESKRLTDFAHDLKEASGGYTNKETEEKIEQIINDISDLAKEKNELDLKLKNFVAQNPTSSPYRLSTKETIVELLNQEKAVSQKLLKRGNELELIRQLGVEGFHFNDHEKKLSNHLKFREFKYLGLLTFSHIFLFYSLMIDHINLAALSLFPTIITFPTLLTFINKLTKAMYKGGRLKPYKTKSLAPKITAQVEKAALKESEHLTFESAEQLILMNSIFSHLGCKVRIEPTSPDKDGTPRIRIGKTKTRIRIGEFSDNAAALENAAELENQLPTPKTQTLTNP